MRSMAACASWRHGHGGAGTVAAVATHASAAVQYFQPCHIHSLGPTGSMWAACGPTAATADSIFRGAHCRLPPAHPCICPAQRVAEEVVDERDWRSRAPLPPADEPSSKQQPSERSERSSSQQAAPEQRPMRHEQQPRSAPADGGRPPAAPAPAPNAASARIQKAADLGREAYRPGATLSGDERSMRTIKGILNKLTPEKFERLLDQLLQVGVGWWWLWEGAVIGSGMAAGPECALTWPHGSRCAAHAPTPSPKRPTSAFYIPSLYPQVITSASVLKSTITMVFENAVAQPTFCAMYADLCLRLSRELPSFPPQVITRMCAPRSAVSCCLLAWPASLCRGCWAAVRWILLLKCCWPLDVRCFAVQLLLPRAPAALPAAPAKQW